MQETRLKGVTLNIKVEVTTKQHVLKLSKNKTILIQNLLNIYEYVLGKY